MDIFNGKTVADVVEGAFLDLDCGLKIIFTDGSTIEVCYNVGEGYTLINVA